MNTILISLGAVGLVVGALLWFVSGTMNSRRKELDSTLEAYEEQSKIVNAARNLSDDERKRVRDRYND